ncbi:uncharacterized protein CTHT_0052190 [Thermochaetoides thermophila DSM 1495]|uniref:Polyamine transport protein n=1 Tax=Chaetomium thermophilum (strain DSM 1495 / CBS 144.50 / IMI 039719) TaxID=759272 RepID=G0SDL3_CHATD|nr:hypothetical protein CTHT_0052190 [Thermochaetoides thermophila DSM 1495]EGS18614.1 hypothetical protein CTHT_0052190 [Thermochaetoides thermophila DSM 1495]
MKANDNGTPKGPPRSQSGNDQSSIRFLNGPYCCSDVQFDAKEAIVVGWGGAKTYFKALQQLSASHHARLDNTSEFSTDPDNSQVPDTDINDPSGAPSSNSITGTDPQATPDQILNHGPGEASRAWGRRIHQLADGRVYEELPLRHAASSGEAYISGFVETPERGPRHSPREIEEGQSNLSSRKSTLVSGGSTPIDFKFKRAVSDMEHLLEEVMELAKQVTEQDDNYGCISPLELKDARIPSPRIVDAPAEAAHGFMSGAIIDNPRVAELNLTPQAQASKQASTNARQQKQLKRYQSAPGMRNTSGREHEMMAPVRLRRSKRSRLTIPERWKEDLPDEQPSQVTQRDRPPVTLISVRKDSEPRSREVKAGDDAPREPGCLFHMKLLRKSQSWRHPRVSPSPRRTRSYRFEVNPRFDNEKDCVQDVPTMPRDKHLKPVKERRRDTSTASCFDGVMDEDDITPIDTHIQQPSMDNTPNIRQPYMSLPPIQRPTEHDLKPSAVQQTNLSITPEIPSSSGQITDVTPARDWSPLRKRFTATVACLSTTAVGIVIGMYAGLVPAIQYRIADAGHHVILGNVLLYLGLAISSFVTWPLPLSKSRRLGRKPYVVGGLAAAIPLLIPQAIASSYALGPGYRYYLAEYGLHWWRWVVLAVSRGLMGIALGVPSANWMGVLMDLFGASLMSGNPHQEWVDETDVRRRGGGMGVWLGLGTWCFTGSLGVGFAVGASIIDGGRSPAWAFGVAGGILLVLLGLNIACPEVRPRLDTAAKQQKNGKDKNDAVKTPWWLVALQGMSLSAEMLRQPGFLVIAVYTGWIYAQIVLIIVLLGALASRYYTLRSTLVGLCVAFISIGGIIAIPFQKANLFSRWRHHQGPTSADTLDDRFVWTSHFVRRAVFCIFLPLFGIAYTVASAGPPIPVEIPTLLAAGIGGLSALAISECNGLIMETFDTSDLPVTSSSASPRKVDQSQWVDPSSYPRVAAGFAVCHAIGFVLAAIATAVGGSAQRHLGQQAATGVVAGILLILTGLLLAVLIRFRNVHIIPNCKTLEMDRWTEMRRESLRRQSQRSSARTSRTSSMAASNHISPTNNKALSVLATDDLAEMDMWRPILLGNPSCKMRRVNVLELGALSRWTEIRKTNRLIDQRAAAHLNRAALGSAAVAVEEATGIAGLVRKVSHRRRHHHHRGTDEEEFHSYNHHFGRDLPFHHGRRHVRGAENEDAQGIELAILGRIDGQENPPAHAGLQGNRENAAEQRIEKARDEFVGSSFDDYGTLRAREVKMRKVTGGEVKMTF